MGEQQLYAVEYRNMHTAVHGLLVYEDLEIASEVDDLLADVSDDAAAVTLGDDMLVDLRQDDLVDADYTEIDYHDVEWDDTLGEYVYRADTDDDPIIVVNTDHCVWDIYGI